MTQFAVIKTGGKQYLVKQDDELIVDRIEAKDKDKVELETLADFDSEKLEVQLGMPSLKQKVSAQILQHLKGDKIRVAKFKAKVRYRRVRGFRPKLTKLKIIKINNE